MHNAPLHILIVEDNPGDVRLAREALQESHIRSVLHLACDGEEALAYLRSCSTGNKQVKPDLVFLDWNLPRKNGKEVLKAIRSNPHFITLPVIVMSSSSAEQDIHAAYRLKANCYVTKPGAYDQYIPMIQSIASFWLT